MSKHWLVLYSGGMDSIVLTHFLKTIGHKVTLVHMNYGQRAQEVEHQLTQQYAKSIGAEVMVFDMQPMFKSILGQMNLNMNAISRLWDQNSSGGGEKDAESSLSYVPFRNTLFLTVGGMCAEQLGIEWITFGSNLSETMTYSDNSEPFIRTMDKVMKLGSNAKNINVRAPLFSLTKTRLVELGIMIGTPFELSNSCYFPVDGQPCGECGSCLLRINAFKRNSTIDPLMARHEKVDWNGCKPYNPTYLDRDTIIKFLKEYNIELELN